MNIPIEEITATRVYFKPTTCSIFLKTSQLFSISTQQELGMIQTPENGGYYDPSSNRTSIYNPTLKRFDFRIFVILKKI